MTTLSNKHVIRKNRYFESEEWKSSDIGEKKKMLAWARGTAQAKKVSEMQQEWQDKVNAAKHLALAAKESKKRKKNERSLKLLEICKKHNGPMTPETAENLNILTSNQLLQEVRYLRATVAPSICEKVKVDGKFRKFNRDELKNEIKRVIKPESNIKNLTELLDNFFGTSQQQQSQEEQDLIQETGL